MIKYCRLCNSPIDVGRRWNGLEPITEYRSAEPGDPDFGQVIDRCPGCGESVTSFHDEGFLLNEPCDFDLDESKTRYIMRLEERVGELEIALKNVLDWFNPSDMNLKEIAARNAIEINARKLLEGGE